MRTLARGAAVRLALALVLLALLCVACLAAPYLTPNDPEKANLLLARQPPGGQFPLGTDVLGRCVLSRVLAGAPVSVFSALCVVGVTALAGTAMGIFCGYFGGLWDSAVMRVTDVFMAFPGMVLAMAAVGMMGKGTGNAVLALVATGWTEYARLARSSTLSLREENYIHAARLNGQRSGEILIKHVLPGVLRPIVVTASLRLGGVILGLSGLSFLGLGAQAPAAEWGSMLADGRGLIQQAPWLVFAPGGAICVASAVFHFLGDAVRDVLDPENGENLFACRTREQPPASRARK